MPTPIPLNAVLPPEINVELRALLFWPTASGRYKRGNRMEGIMAWVQGQLAFELALNRISRFQQAA
jgi:hypothetical protein